MNKNIKSIIEEMEQYFPEDESINNVSPRVNWRIGFKLAYASLLIVTITLGFWVGRITAPKEIQFMGVEHFLNQNFDYYLPVPIDSKTFKEGSYSLHYAINKGKKYAVVNVERLNVQLINVFLNNISTDIETVSFKYAFFEYKDNAIVNITCDNHDKFDFTYTFDSSLFTDLLVKSQK